jgi:ATP-dependent Lon protease
MRRSPKNDSELPAGFEYVGLDNASLLLPTAAAKLLRQRIEAQEVLDVEERRRRREAIHPPQQPTQPQLAAKVRTKRKVARANAKSGWHRVLPKLADLAKELDDVKSLERSADVDVNQRRRRILERLLELGPDRRIAMPKDWRTAVDDLHDALPNFAGPVRALRNALALAEATKTAPRMAPQLLLGPPGVGKTLYSHRVAELFGSVHASVQFDQPSAGAQLRGSDKYWSNTEPGILFNLIGLGEFANPVLLLDEMDKSSVSSTNGRELNPLVQLHGALERETAQRLNDISVDVEFDASLTTYIGTANSLRGIGAPILSRMEVFDIQPPTKWQAIDIATNISRSTLQRLGLVGRIDFERQALYLLAYLSPRVMIRAAENAIAAAVADGRRHVGEAELWNELGGPGNSALH